MASAVPGFRDMKHRVFTANLSSMERQAKTDFADVANLYFKKTKFWITNQ